MADTQTLNEEEAPAVVSFSQPSSSSQPSKPTTKRVWLQCCLICSSITIVLVVVLIPVLLLVAFPKIAQSNLYSSRIHFDVINITTPANDSFIMHIMGEVSNAGIFGASIHFPEPVSVYWEGNDSLLLGNVTLNDLSVNGGKGSINSDSNFTVLNLTAFTEFTEYLLLAQGVKWRLSGVADASALGKTAKGLNLDKTIFLYGMGGFPNIKILNITLPVTNTPSKGVEIDLLVLMDNASPLGMQLGNVNMRLEYEGTTLGPAVISNFFLAAGTNNVPIKTVLLPQSSSEDSQHVSDLLSKFIENIPAETTAFGLSAYPNGNDPIAWLTPAIQSLVLHVDFVAPDPATLNSSAKSFAQSSINGASLSFNAINITNEAANSFTTSLDVLLNDTGPLSATIQFPDPVQIFYNNMLLGSVAMPSVDVASGTGHLTGPNSSFSISNSTSFGEFTKALLMANNFQWTLIGNVSVVALNRTFTDLMLNKTVVLNGLNGLQGVQVQSFNLPNNTATTINMGITSVMHNPSPIGVQLGVANFQIFYKGVFIGPVASAPGYFLTQGDNTLNLSGMMVHQNDSNSLNIVSQMFSSYIDGDVIEMTVQGVSALPDGTNEVAWLEPAITALNLSVTLNNTAGKSQA